MNVTFRKLKVFESVARQLSYTRAAEELHLTQPAVSMQIKQLEDQVGLPLFEQLGKKIFLTEAGREMYHYSRAIAQQLEEAERVIAELKGVQRGRLSIAVASTANYFATRLLATFSQRYADVTISLDVTNREGLLRHLDDNDDDLVIMGRPPQGLDLVAEPFMKNPLVIIAPPAHPLIGELKIPLARIQQETFVARAWLGLAQCDGAVFRGQGRADHHRYGDEQQRGDQAGGGGGARPRHRVDTHAGIGAGIGTPRGARRGGLSHHPALVRRASPGQALVARRTGVQGLCVE